MKNLQLLLFCLTMCLTTTAQLVVHVYDGDTYRILHDGKLQVIRLANVDAPELTQYYGTKVKQTVSKLMLGKTVSLEFAGINSYQRKVARVLIDGKHLDSLLLAQGLAWYYRPYSTNNSLCVYESLARLTGAGMWRCMYNVPPWTWRQLDKKEKRLNEMCR
jgi:endonuclease YncB( thermonuclease family)